MCLRERDEQGEGKNLMCVIMSGVCVSAFYVHLCNETV